MSPANGRGERRETPLSAPISQREKEEEEEEGGLVPPLDFGSRARAYKNGDRPEAAAGRILVGSEVVES